MPEWSSFQNGFVPIKMWQVDEWTLFLTTWLSQNEDQGGREGGREGGRAGGREVGRAFVIREENVKYFGERLDQILTCFYSRLVMTSSPWVSENKQ